MMGGEPLSEIPLIPEMLDTLLTFQQAEITEHEIYRRIWEVTPDPHNNEVLARIAPRNMNTISSGRNIPGVILRSSGCGFGTITSWPVFWVLRLQ